MISMKFSRTPRLHFRFDFLQLWQLGMPSSHLRWRSLHVRHPVRTCFGLLAIAEAGSSASAAPASEFFCETGLWSMVLERCGDCLTVVVVMIFGLAFSTF